MKLLICSDIHGDLDSAKAVIEAYKSHQCDKILCLGDILYHGPRNDLPSTYAPKEVIALLNQYADVILAVRGNCDTEVDQMVLNFPILADYAILHLGDRTIYATHGHKFNTETPPPLVKGDILLHGHTHILGVTPFGNENHYMNPGSIALPKNGNPRSYIVFDGCTFRCYDLCGNELFTF